MKLWIASYNKLIYELKINSNKWKVIDMKEVKLEYMKRHDNSRYRLRKLIRPTEN